MPVTSSFKFLRIGNEIELFDPYHGCAVTVRIEEFTPGGKEIIGTIVEGVALSRTARCGIRYNNTSHEWEVHIIDERDHNWDEHLGLRSPSADYSITIMQGVQQ